MRDQRLAAVEARLQLIDQSHDLSPVLEPEAHREAQELAENHSAGDLEAQFTLGRFHWYRYHALPEGEDQADLTAAVEAFTVCFAAGIAGLPEPLLPLLADAAAPLAVRMFQNALVSPSMDRLSAVADLWQRIVQATPVDHPERAGRLSNLGGALQVRFERTGVQGDLDTAIAVGREAVTAIPVDHPDRARMLSNLGGALQARFERTGMQGDLDTAIAVGQEAVTAIPVDHPDRARMLSNLGGALQARFERTGTPGDLDTAIDHLRNAVAATPVDHPYRARMLSNLGNVLRVRFERTGAQEDLDTAIDHLRNAVAAARVDHPERATMLSNLGGALQVRFERSGMQGDLDTAIAAGREAVAATPVDHPERARMLSNLGGALQARFERTGTQGDLDTAVAVGQEAVTATPVDHPERAGRLSNLGNVLRVRFERTGMQGDLDTAIAVGRDAVAAARVDHPDRARMLSNLGGALQARFERTGTPGDLDTAIDHLRKALAATPVDHPYRARRLFNLGNVLRVRFERTGTPGDLDTAIDHLRKALAATPVDHPYRARRLSNLGNVLRVRFERTGTQGDLDTAITVGQEAVATTPVDHPDRAVTLSNLAGSLRARFGRTGTTEDMDQAASCWLEASEVSAAAPSVRVRAGLAAAGLLTQSGDVGQAAETAEAAVRLLAQVAPRRLERGDQEYAVGSFAGLAATAAALALADPGGTAAGRAERALQLLDSGRAVLLSQALEIRSDLTDLREHYPGLARRFAELRERLDAPTSTTAPEADIEVRGMRPQQERLVRDRHQTADEFTALLTEIRNLDGFSSFALPPTTDQLLSQASKGPVVVFNISDLRSDALLLTTEGITSLELPHLIPDRVIGQVNAFRRALQLAVSGADLPEREGAQATLVEVLQWLWDAAAGPVLEELGHESVPAVDGGDCEEKWPRVWWAPGGLLSLLPLHAAGYHTDSADDPHRRTVMDRVISSYTPTVRALRYARERTLSPAAVRSLIVAMPTTPGLPNHGRLRFVEAEATMLQTRLLAPVLLREPAPTDGFLDPTRSMPTKANVLEHMPECAIVHFACHGASDPTDPSKSHLLLHDHMDDPLTVASLAPVALGRARLAYLSACRTAAIDTSDLLDEAIHLTSAFQLAGFPHVIGTLWEIDDQIAVTIADLFYANLQTDSRLDPAQAAHALHSAVRKVRDGHGLRAPFDRRRAPLLWAAYLHAGA
ncbi:CHAT domain-containing protein [Streptomyces sp. NBC_00554]|uniref:CHAT domain-containing tetratricopeptide repeat protein n=1 Tax=Streptomyces sp. NBC_00554 TaxID=2903661 RepID=UPI00352D320B|nr:CHAT domain-containing protein [Streptomyces sp. NBC_00554]